MFSRLYHEQFALLSNETQEAITAEVLMVAPSFRNWWSNRDIWAEWADDLVWGSSQSGDALIRLWEQAVCEDIRDWAFEQLLDNHATRLKKTCQLNGLWHRGPTLRFPRVFVPLLSIGFVIQ